MPASAQEGILRRAISQTIGRTLGACFDVVAGDFPHTVRIETTNACNAKCVICPHPSMSRPIRRMDPALYERIIRECSENRCREIHLHNFGEPLLDKDLPDRIKRAKDLGIKKVKIFSNGSLITEPAARSLIEAGLDELKISIDGATKEEFERIRTPLKYDKVMDNLTALVRLRNERQARLKISVNCCSTTGKGRTMEALARLVDEFHFARLHNWAEGDYPDRGRRIRQPCIRLWRTFTILVNGDVALCCLDYDGKVRLGRIDERTTLREVWRNHQYNQVRHLHRLGQQNGLALCQTCSKACLHLPSWWVWR